MSTAKRAKPAGLIEQTVAEAVDAVAAPSVRKQVLALALHRARCSRIPERGPAVAAFVEGPLFHVLAHFVGEHAATTVRDELVAVAAMVADEEVSEVRPSWPVEAAAARWDTDPAPSRELPLLVVASSSPIAVSALSAALRGGAYIEPARDALAVVEGLGRSDHGAIVLDCRNPAIQVETLLAMEPELPAGTRVVLWGERPELEQRLGALGAPLPRSWVCCGPGATAEDVAAVCRVLLG